MASLYLSTLLSRLRPHLGRIAIGIVILVLATAVGLYYGGLVSLSPYYHWRQAQDAVKRHDLRKALEHLEVCLDDWPSDAATHFTAARVYRRAGDTAKAREELQHAHRLGYPVKSITLEQLLMEAQNGSSDALDTLKTRLKDADRDDRFQIYEALAVGYVALRAPEAGLDLTTRWVEEFPDDWQPLYLRSTILEMGTSYEAAVADIRKVLAMRPELHGIRLMLANYEWRRGAYRESIEPYRAVLAQDPDNLMALGGLARSLYGLGDFDEARTLVVRLLDRDPDNVDGLTLHARLNLEFNQPEEALRAARAAEKLSPRRQDVVQAVADSLRRLQRPEASAYLQRAVALTGIQTQRELKFVALFNLKDDASQEKQARSVALRYEIASLSYQIGLDGEALAWAQSALQRDPQHQPSRDLLKELTQGPAKGPS